MAAVWSSGEEAHMSYEEIKTEIEQLPQTWIPALVLILIEQAVKKKCFKQGGLTRLVQEIENRQTEEP